MLKSRVESIDLLRGTVMIFMALDHVRDYFHWGAFHYDPTDLSKTSVVLFFTRWITHYCAPTFVFLAGTSAFIVGTRKGTKELSVFLLKRGLWLIFLELVVVNFGWFFNIHLPLLGLLVIWAIGFGMLMLAAFVYLPWQVILTAGVILVAGHNALDGYHVAGDGAWAMTWSVLHEFNFFNLSTGQTLLTGYPVIAWTGVMFLGYCFGKFYTPSFDPSRRKKILIYLGSSAIVLFIVLRFINGYGDSNHWSTQSSPLYTFLSFLKVSKYPPSLLYVLMTLGPGILFLALTEDHIGAFARKITVLGRVPMFYYLVHIYLIHIFAMAAAVFAGYSPSVMILNTWVNNSPDLTNYGFGLGATYLVWIGLLIVLYPLCQWYDAYKMNHREKWWLSYL